MSCFPKLLVHARADPTRTQRPVAEHRGDRESQACASRRESKSQRRRGVRCRPLCVPLNQASDLHRLTLRHSLIVYRARRPLESDSDALAKARKEAAGLKEEPKKPLVGQGRREMATDDQVSLAPCRRTLVADTPFRRSWTGLRSVSMGESNSHRDLGIASSCCTLEVGLLVACVTASLRALSKYALFIDSRASIHKLRHIY